MHAHAPLAALALLPLALGAASTPTSVLTYVPANTYIPDATTIRGGNQESVITAASGTPDANGTALISFYTPKAGDQWITGGDVKDGMNWASWWPAAGVETDLWLGGLKEPISLAKNVAPRTVGAGYLGRNVTSGKGFYVFITEAGNVDKILGQSAQFDIRRSSAASGLVAPALGVALGVAGLALALV
ncbi:uncharacterized protein LOC62_07G009147 [Vanrija pseudolonga]|uniref:Uncharacterized protein n=1 Tax=Vanrija pseudolonga TaxID=143232 RepID=A0AAF1BPP5_9TREE|nr:hypothetical protein LOC62_07G009147 [Vanrija pseudolonga]